MWLLASPGTFDTCGATVTNFQFTLKSLRTRLITTCNSVARLLNLVLKLSRVQRHTPSMQARCHIPIQHSKGLPVQNQQKNTREMCGLCSKLTMNTPEQRCFVSLLLTLFRN